MSRGESLERQQPIEFEGGTISSAWYRIEPESFERGMDEFHWSSSWDTPPLRKREVWQEAKWRDEEQGRLFRPQDHARALELAELRFDHAMKIRGRGGVEEWLEKYNAKARQYNQNNGLAADNPRAMPMYALANKLQLLAWDIGTGDEVADWEVTRGKTMIAAGSMASAIGYKWVPCHRGTGTVPYFGFDMLKSSAQFRAGTSFLLVRIL